MVKIIPLCEENLSDVNRANQPFAVIGRLIPFLNDSRWSCSEELYDTPYYKTYPDDDAAFYAAHLNVPDKGAYLAYSGGECVGQLVLRADWNGYGFIEDICVAKEARRQGIGRMLIQTAADWARDKGLSGLALETQDNNLQACRFYQRMGFQIGGVNTMFYRNFPSPTCGETAIFWYLIF